MKKVITIALIGLMILSCKNEVNNNTFTFYGDFKEVPNGEVFLIRNETSEINGSLVTRLDTISKALVTDGKFVLTGSIEHPEEFSLSTIKEVPDYGKRMIPMANLWIAPETQSYSGTLGGFPTIMVAEGVFGKKMYAYQQNAEYQKALKEHLELSANPNTDLETQSLKMHASQKLAQLTNDFKFKALDDYKKHPFFAAMLLQMELMDDNADFEKLAVKKDSIKALLSDYDATTGVLMDKLYAYLKKRSENVALGKTYTEVLGVNKAGEVVALSDVLKKNKYVLLDFWASWCGPCRGEFPYMRTVYPEYHNKGFEIFALSIDKKKDAWLKASDEENVPWINALMDPDTKYQENYSVTKIPANFLIDSNGIIIAKDLRHDGLVKKLKELLD